MAITLAVLNIRYARAREKMKKLEAVSEETAKRPDELEIPEWILERLAHGRGGKQTADGRYYVECKDKKHC